MPASFADRSAAGRPRPVRRGFQQRVCLATVPLPSATIWLIKANQTSSSLWMQ
jgi:hypothetical protein